MRLRSGDGGDHGRGDGVESLPTDGGGGANRGVAVRAGGYEGAEPEVQGNFLLNHLGIRLCARRRSARR
ncbi:MAG: hypothetical protein U0232_15860 [Thermomicrobiales bacterium]